MFSAEKQNRKSKAYSVLGSYSESLLLPTIFRTHTDREVRRLLLPFKELNMRIRV